MAQTLIDVIEGTGKTLLWAEKRESATTDHVSIKSYGKTVKASVLLLGLTENHSEEYLIISANYYNLICSIKLIMKNVSVFKILIFNTLIYILFFYIDIK